jgi:hypothetical protein
VTVPAEVALDAVVDVLGAIQWESANPPGADPADTLLPIGVGRLTLESEANPPKAHPPGKGAPQPAVGEGGRPFEPGRVRGDLTLRA